MQEEVIEGADDEHDVDGNYPDVRSEIRVHNNRVRRPSKWRTIYFFIMY